MTHGKPIGRIVTTTEGTGGFFVAFKSAGPLRPMTVYELVRDDFDDGVVKLVEVGPSCIPRDFTTVGEGQTNEVCFGQEIGRLVSASGVRCLTRAEFARLEYDQR